MGSNLVDKNEGERKRQKGERERERGGNRIEEREKKNKKGVSLLSKIYRNRAVGFRRSEK